MLAVHTIGAGHGNKMPGNNLIQSCFLYTGSYSSVVSYESKGIISSSVSVVSKSQTEIAEMVTV